MLPFEPKGGSEGKRQKFQNEAWGREVRLWDNARFKMGCLGVLVETADVGGANS